MLVLLRNQGMVPGRHNEERLLADVAREASPDPAADDDNGGMPGGWHRGIRLVDLGNPATMRSTRVEAGAASLAHRTCTRSEPRGTRGRSICKATSVSTESPNPDPAQQATRDIAEVPAVEVITTAAIHLMSAAAVKCGLAEGQDAHEHLDLDEARRLINALAGLVTAAAPDLGSQHAAPLRDGLKSLQLAFREASVIPDAPGQGPGEKLTGSVV
jgi:hypothetical protein